MSGNHIANFVDWYTKHGPNPMITAGLLGGGAWLGSKLLWGPTVETLRSIGRPIGTALLGGSSNPHAYEEWQEAMDNLKTDSSLAKWVPRAIGAVTLAGLLEAFRMPNQPYMGLTKWYPGTHAKELPKEMQKDGSFQDPFNPVQNMSMNSYVNELDWNRPIHASNVIGLFKNDPHLASEPYARNMGISIVADASLNQQTRNPTLGSIFDSAVNKIENKLTFGGLTNVALKTAVANGVSRLFAGSVGAMCDLSPRAQQSLVDAGTWAGAITSMLN